MPLAMGAHLQFMTAGGPADLAVGETQLFELQQLPCPEILEAPTRQQPLLRLDQAPQLGQEPGVDGAELVQLGIGVAPHHRGAHRHDPIGGRGAHGALQLAALIGSITGGIRPVTAPAGQARFQGAQGLLEGFLKTAPDRHRLAHRFHRGGEHRWAAAELLEREAGNLGHHVIDRGFEAGRRGTGDVVDDFVEAVAHRQPGGDLGNREASGLGGQGGGTGDAGVHLNHHHIPIEWIDGELDVGTAGIDADLADDRDRLVAQPLVFAVGEGLGRCHGDRITRVHPHRIEVFNAAYNHHVVGGVAHHLQLKLLPAQQRLLHQDLADRTGLQAALADRPEFLRVVSDAAAAAPQGEGGPNDARVGADHLAHLLGFLEGVGNAGGAHRHADAGHGLLEEQAILRHANRFEIGPDQLDSEALQGAVLGQGHRQVEGRLASHGGQQGIGPLDLDHPRHHLGGQGLDVGAVGQIRIGHD